MADPNGISGIRATGLCPVAILKKDNYRSWSVKLKVQLKVMDCWALVTGTELKPPAIALAVNWRETCVSLQLAGKAKTTGTRYMESSAMMNICCWVRVSGASTTLIRAARIRD